MKKLLLILTTVSSILLVSCGINSLPETVDMSPVKIDAFSNDDFLTYAAKGEFKKGHVYTLQSEVIIHEENSELHLFLDKKDLIADEDTKILTHGILLEDIKARLDSFEDKSIKENFKNLDYSFTVFVATKTGLVPYDVPTILKLNETK